MSAAEMTAVRACRICGSAQLAPVVDLGEMPLANAFVRPERAQEPEPRYPLAVVRCLACGLVQLTVVVRPDILFRDYAYSSSASPPLLDHFRALAERLVPALAPPGSLVVEIGSNDGVLLAPLRARGARVLGIEPASNVAAVANARGLETWNEFFGPASAERVASDRGRAAVVVANNVLAHIADLPDVVRALDALLTEDGVFVAEVPYLVDLLEHVEYDTVYHEHLSYFHLTPLSELFAQRGFELIDVEQLSVHGGSLRVYAARRGRRPTSPRVADVRAREARAGLSTPEVYARFAERVHDSRGRLRLLLAERTAAGARLAGYGATAKGNTLLNFCAIGPDTLRYIADTTAYKQGLLTPGMRVPVRSEGALDEDPPDLLLLLAWNYADAIVRRLDPYVRRGGRFIHPIPTARIIPA